jgi:hypothetical protein
LRETAVDASGDACDGEEQAEDYFCHVESPCDSLSACAVLSRVERNNHPRRSEPNEKQTARQTENWRVPTQPAPAWLEIDGEFFFVFATRTVQNGSVSAIINAFINLPT